MAVLNQWVLMPGKVLQITASFIPSGNCEVDEIELLYITIPDKPLWLGQKLLCDLTSIIYKTAGQP